jgi:hypothetical protein
MADPRAAEALDGKGEAHGVVIASQDNLPGDPQGQSVLALCPSRNVAKDISFQNVALLVDAIDVPARGAV